MEFEETKTDAWHPQSISVIPEQECCLGEITQYVIWTTACQMTLVPTNIK